MNARNTLRSATISLYCARERCADLARNFFVYSVGLVRIVLSKDWTVSGRFCATRLG
jgi:hypothetical protein